MKIPALVILALSFAVISCNEQKTKNDKPVVTAGDVQNNATATKDATPQANVPVMSFQEETHDFGRIKQGEKVTTDFRFTNSGTAPLIISSAVGNCGCTVGEYPRHPVKPGETGSIKVTFDSAGKSGANNKTVTITANTVPATKELKVLAEVEVPKEGGTTPSAH